MYIKEYEIKYYEQNWKGDLKESALLNFLQDIATLSAESLGFGYTFTFQNGYAWVVLKYHIELYEEIKDYSKKKKKTESRGTTKLYAFRDFEICTRDDRLIGRAVSAWVLIDINSRKILPMQKVLSFVSPYEKRPDDLDYEKIENFDTSQYQKTFEVRYDDIDVNRHANNSNYLVWALETLPVEFRKKHYPSSIDIKYRKETTVGKKVQSFAKIFDNYSLHIIKDSQDNEELCSVKINWKY